MPQRHLIGLSIGSGREGVDATLIRMSGAGLLAVFGILIATGYGLYYAGGDKLREWISFVHLWVGMALPLLIVAHIWMGRMTRKMAARHSASELERSP